MGFLKKVTSSIAKQPAKTQLPADALALQQKTKAFLKENLDNVASGVPDVVKSQQEAMKGLAALSDQIKATLPK